MAGTRSGLARQSDARHFGGARGSLRLRRTTRMLAMALALLSIAFVATIVIEEGQVGAFFLPQEPAGTLHSAQFSVCGSGARVTCVVDGDTIWLEGTKIRIADIDTPEVSSPSCSAELALGRKATARLTVLLNEGPFEVLPYERDTDVYGRKLRILSRDGTSLGATLVDEGLAHVWDGARHPWCG